MLPGELGAGADVGVGVGGSDGMVGGGGHGDRGAGGGSQGSGRRGSAGAAASVGLPAAQIGRIALGVCEGLQRLHEVGGWVRWDVVGWVGG